MTRTLATLASAMCLMTSAAFAGPTVMTDEQMESQVAGAAIIKTKSGNTVWTVTNLDPLEGTNNGGNGRTDRAGPGLLKASMAGGLNVMVMD